jgi:hypothetical protein
MAMSETTLASGFVDGSIIISSLTSRKPLLTIRPFRVPVVELSMISDEKIFARWGKCSAEVSQAGIDWVELPKCEGGVAATLAQGGALAIARGGSTDVYSFPDQALIGRIPQRPIGLWCNGRRTYVLTIRQEVVVLYCHGPLRVEAQFVVKVDNPVGILAAHEIVYIICRNAMVPFDQTGKSLDPIPFKTRPRFYDTSAHCVYFVYGKTVSWIGTDLKIGKMQMEAAVTALAAIDDARCAVAVKDRLIICDHGGAKLASAPLVKYDKRILGMKAFASQVGGVTSALFAVFEDGSTGEWQLPRERDTPS